MRGEVQETELTQTSLCGQLPKAEALQEAKRWLRSLTAREVANLEAALPGDTRGAERERKPSVSPEPIHPFEHPHYWAAFILIGDPH